jgi:hypothetical protein
MYQGADHIGRRVLNTGGGGGAQTSTTYTSNIPEWLRPQTEALLGAATQEYFQTAPRTVTDPNTGETRTEYDITGIKGYKPYSADKESYFAPFSQQQQNVFSEVGGMRTSPAYGQAAGMTRQAGMGGMGTAQQALGYGQLGTGYGGMAAGMAPEAQLYGRTAADIGTMGLRAEELGRDVGEEARQFARQAAGMGGLYEQMATDPMSMQGYMSPYMQQVVERQKLAAIEDAQRANLGQNLAAARQGTYGGARQALAQSQREAALEKQMGDIQAQGLQNAFQQAQQAQQFGVTTGLQGLQGAQAGLGTALQGGQLGLSGIGQAMAGQQAGLAGLGQASQLYGQGMQGAQVGLQGLGAAQAGYGLTGQMGAQLGNLATAQQQADIQRLGLQTEIGGIQQARDQAVIDQAIQDYAVAQQYPFQQLAGYSGLLRGYATPTTTVSQYQARPSGLTQLAGLGTTAVGLGQLAGVGGKKEGGVIKFAEGGITDTDAIEGMAEDLSIPQLQQSMRNDTLPEYIGMPILANKVNQAERMQIAQAGIAPNMGQEVPIANQVMQRANQLQGIDTVQTAAGGGMVAFNNGGIARFQNTGLVAPSQYQGIGSAGKYPLGIGPQPPELDELIKKYGKNILKVLKGAKSAIGLSPSQLLLRTNSLNENEAEQLRQYRNLAEFQAAYDDISDSPFSETFNAPAAGPKQNAPAAGPANQPAPGANPAAQAGPAGIAPEAAPLTIAEMLKQREAEERAFVGEDPRIKKMQEMLKKQGEEPFLDRASRALQMIAAGEQLRTKGDTAGLKESMATEAARRKAMAEREEKLTQLEGADYERRAGIFKEMAGERREDEKTKKSQAFQERVLERKISAERDIARMRDPAARERYVADLLRSKNSEDRRVGEILAGAAKTGTMTRAKALEMYYDLANVELRKQYPTFEAFLAYAMGTGSGGAGGEVDTNNPLLK